jgi:hypothetical protein
MNYTTDERIIQMENKTSILEASRMNEIQMFNSEKFGEVRTVVLNGKTWFVANDVAKALGYVKPNNAINEHCRTITKYKIPHPQSENKIMITNLIPEDDVIKIIGSSKTKSEKFKNDFIEWLKSVNLISDTIVLSTRHEIEFFEKLKKTLISFNLKINTQHHILNYKLDGYIP